MPRAKSTDISPLWVRLTVDGKQFGHFQMQEFVDKFSPNEYFWCFENKTKKGKRCKPHYHAWIRASHSDVFKYIKEIGFSGPEFMVTGAGNLDEQVKLVAYAIKQGDYSHKGVSEDTLAKAKELDKEYKDKNVSVYDELDEAIKFKVSKWVLDDEEYNYRDGVISQRLDQIISVVLEYYKSRRVVMSKAIVTNYCMSFAHRYVPGYSRVLHSDIKYQLMHK